MSREMKHSGIEWIGEIPKEWKTISFSNGILRMSTGLNPRDNFELSKDDEYYYVTIKNFKDGKIYLDDNCDRISKQAWGIIQERSQLEKGDILFASISKDGQAYILEESPVNWNINESVFSIRTNHDYFADKYFYYHIIDSEYYNDLRLDATGTTFQSIKQNKLRKSILCLPPLHEQQKIANYLDKVCGEVDEMIALQEQMIEELKAYKQSVITEAVTKGLNPDVPMKDSGIDWIGDIPEGWSVCRIKNIIVPGKEGIKIGPFGSALTNNVIDNGTYKIYGQWNIVGKDFHAGKNYVSENTFESLNSYAVKEGDILISMMGTIGKCAVIPNKIQEGIMDSHVIKIRIDKAKINNSFFEYIYDRDCSNFVYHQICRMKKGSIMDGLNSSIIKNLYLLIPSLSEQQSIASYLDTKCAEIDALIAIKQAKINELKEYKKSVIYEYVTGKKEVV